MHLGFLWPCREEEYIYKKKKIKKKKPNQVWYMAFNCLCFITYYLYILVDYQFSSSSQPLQHCKTVNSLVRVSTCVLTSLFGEVTHFQGEAWMQLLSISRSDMNLLTCSCISRHQTVTTAGSVNPFEETAVSWVFTLNP